MKRTTIRVLGTATAMVLLVGSCFAGPFGFEYGMTKDQIIKLVGKAAVKEDRGDMLDLTTAPKPHEMFESYTLYISPEHGLLKILAISRDIPTSKYGEEMRDQFDRIRTGLERVYGATNRQIRFLESGKYLE